MNTSDSISQILENLDIPKDLADDLVKYFFKLKEDLTICDLERSSAGKFVETVVQIFQALDPTREGKYTASVTSVEHELKYIYDEGRETKTLPADSRQAIARMARVIYSLRSKRSIIHKNGLDPTIFDLEIIYQTAQWIITELIRLSKDTTMENAREIIEEVQRPVYPFVEVILGKPLVIQNGITTEEELLLLFHNCYQSSDLLNRKEIGTALKRRSPSTVTKALKRMWQAKIIEGNKDSYRLTKFGLIQAHQVIQKLTVEKI